MIGSEGSARAGHGVVAWVGHELGSAKLDVAAQRCKRSERWALPPSGWCGVSIVGWVAA